MIFNYSIDKIRSVLRNRTLSHGLQQPQDNFLLLRFIAAAMVIYGHGEAITDGKGLPELFSWLGWGTYSGAIAVDLFFITSGFLITGSFLRRRNVMEFLWARFLRLVPACFVCMAGSAFILGAICTKLPLKEYFYHSDVWNYVLKNTKLGPGLAWDLPGVFTDNPHRTTVNGSIWTLPAEVRMYLWAAFLGITGILGRKRLAFFVLLGLVLYGIIFPDSIPLVPIKYVRLAALFAMGGLCYILREQMPVHGSLVIVSAFLCWLFRSTVAYPYFFAIAEGTFVFWFAYAMRWHGFNRFGDYSYGIYLWGFPMQQVVASLLPNLSPIQNAILGFMLALILAIISWHIIEKPVLKMKNIFKKIFLNFQMNFNKVAG